MTLDQTEPDEHDTEADSGQMGSSGWMSLIKALPPDQLPRAPSTFILDDGIRDNTESLDGSSLHDHHQTQSYTSRRSHLQAEYDDGVLEPAANATTRLGPDSVGLLASSTSAEAIRSLQAEQNSMWISPYRTPSAEPFLDHGNTHNSPADTRIPLAPQLVEYEGRAHVGNSSSQFTPTRSDELLTRVTEVEREQALVSQSAMSDHDSEAEPLGSEVSLRRSARQRKVVPISTVERPLKRQRTESRKQPKPKTTSQTAARPVLDPSQEFTGLYNAAREALLDDGDPSRAQSLVLQAIALNPEIFAAHSLLADIHYLRGHNELAVDALMTGLHGHGNEVELWRGVADTILDNPHESQQKKVERAMYCFSAIIRKDPKDLDARYQRAECARELRQYNKSIIDFEILLQEDPYNSTILAAYMRLCVEINDAAKVRKVYEALFEHFSVVGLSEESHYTWQDIGHYCDLVSTIGETELAILKFRRLARALSGRQDEHYWDDVFDDDREFDQDHLPRRIETPQFELDHHPNESYGMAVPLDLRGKLGILRLRLNFRDEACNHFSWLQADERGEEALVHEYFDTYWEVGRALHEAEEHAQALSFFHALQAADIDLGIEFWHSYAKSLQHCQKTEEAIAAFQKVIDLDPQNVEARTSISELYTIKGDRTTALKFGREAVTCAQDTIPTNARQRKYERREQRLIREAAERALRVAYRMPQVPGAQPRKLPAELKSRSRFSRAWRRTRLDFLRDSIQPEDQAMPIDAQRVDVDSSLKKKGGPPTRSRPPPVPKPPSSKQMRAASLYDEMQQHYATVIAYQENMRDGDETAIEIWSEAASAMTDHFRTVKAIFPIDKRRYEGFNSFEPAPEPSPNHVSKLDIPNADRIPRLVSPSLPDSYCGIPYALWLDLHLELALLISLPSPDRVATSQQRCYGILNTALAANVFYHHLPSLTQIHVCYLSCALNFSDEPTVFSVVLRWFMRTFAYCTDTYRLFTAVNYLYDYPSIRGGKTAQLDRTVFKSGPSQKFVFRQLTSLDAALPDDYGVGTEQGSVPQFMRLPREGIRRDAHLQPASGHKCAQLSSRNAHSVSQSPGQQNYHGSAYPNARAVPAHEMDAVLFILYAHIMMASNSYPNALSYLYRAYSLDANNPVCLLSMALCYMQQLFKRQNEKRHQWALMGWTWFKRYEESRRRYALEQDKLCAAQGQGGSLQSPHEIDGEAPNGHAPHNRRVSRMVDIVEQEIAFNRGRCWEMLGMADLAVRQYKIALTISRRGDLAMGEVIDKDQDLGEGQIPQDEDWTMEAAYAVSMVYARNGDAAQARDVVEKYLVV